MLLTDPLELFLPAFHDAKVQTTYGLEPARLPITLLDLIRHTAGIGSATVYPDSPVGKFTPKPAYTIRNSSLPPVSKSWPLCR